MKTYLLQIILFASTFSYTIVEATEQNVTLSENLFISFLTSGDEARMNCMNNLVLDASKVSDETASDCDKAVLTATSKGSSKSRQLSLDRRLLEILLDPDATSVRECLGKLSEAPTVTKITKSQKSVPGEDEDTDDAQMEVYTLEGSFKVKVNETELKVFTKLVITDYNDSNCTFEN